jgi:hypothetical protein
MFRGWGASKISYGNKSSNASTMQQDATKNATKSLLDLTMKKPCPKSLVQKKENMLQKRKKI